MTRAEVPACDECGEHHREEGECAMKQKARDEWDTWRAW